VVASEVAGLKVEWHRSGRTEVAGLQWHKDTVLAGVASGASTRGTEAGMASVGHS